VTSFCKVTTCTSRGGTAANAQYILRESACARWDTRHIDEHLILGNTALERKRSAIEELSAVAEAGDGCRKSFRVILSFEREVPPERALAMAREFLNQSPLRDNPALLAVHTNTDHVHVHAAVTVRKTDGLKIQLDRQEYRSFDKLWAKIYQHELTRDAAPDRPGTRGIETQREAVAGREISLEEWRRRYGQLRRDGRTPDEIKAIIGPRPGRPRLEVRVHHIRKNEHEKSRVADSLRGARSVAERAARAPGAEAGRARWRALDGPDAGRRAERAAGGERPAPERARGGGLDLAGRVQEFVGRLPKLAGDPEQILVREFQRVGSQLAAVCRNRIVEYGRTAPAGGPRRVRAHADRLAHGFSGRFGERVATAAGVNFTERLYPALRCCERYLQQLPLRFDDVRARFKQLYDRAWLRFTGRTPGFREEYELNRKEPPLRREQPLDVRKTLGHILFRGPTR